MKTVYYQQLLIDHKYGRRADIYQFAQKLHFYTLTYLIIVFIKNKFSFLSLLYLMYHNKLHFFKNQLKRLYIT